MKIILSPSKTQNHDISVPNAINITKPKYDKMANQLNKILAAIDPSSLSKCMKIDGALLKTTYDNIHQFNKNPRKPALLSYNGLVYKYLNIDPMKDAAMMTYFKENLIILSALYGALNPYDGIKPYRLDMNTRIMDETLYSFWHKAMKETFKNEEILDLASKEFSKMVPYPKVTVIFKQEKEGKFINMATYAKMARGLLLKSMAENNITKVSALKTLTFDSYVYNETLSSPDILCYSRPYPNH